RTGTGQLRSERSIRLVCRRPGIDLGRGFYCGKLSQPQHLWGALTQIIKYMPGSSSACRRSKQVHDTDLAFDVFFLLLHLLKILILFTNNYYLILQTAELVSHSIKA